MGTHYRISAALFAGAAIAAIPGVSLAEPVPIYTFDIPAKELGEALRDVATRAGWELYADAKDVHGLTAPAISGNLTAKDAIMHLLHGTTLHATFTDGVIKIRRSPRYTEAQAPEAGEGDIVVTGSRIVGAPPSAPVFKVSEEDIRNAGQTDLGQVARSLPMNFGGGQNPGIGLGQGAGNNENVNVNGSSTFNLRGIGSNATLTLLNGNRVGYTGSTAAVDISAIPVAAIQRVEVVADGASAIYGSDAVAGVVNIILKPDYKGLWTSARIGSSTDGGDFEQGFSTVWGTKWSTGGLMAVYDFANNTAIKAGQRSYTSSMNPSSTLYPQILRHDGLLTAHQEMAPGITLSADATYKNGHQDAIYGYSSTLPVTYTGGGAKRDFESFGVTPTLKFELPSAWSAKITGYYGDDTTSGVGTTYTSDIASATQSYFKNESWSLEGSAQGPLFTLPAGSVRLALGGGIRRYHFLELGSGINENVWRTNHFAYAEAFAPLIAPRQSIPLIYRASVTAAVRIEDYSDSARIATPKVGANFTPFRSLELKASWGRSYKVPSLFQQYSGYATILFSGASYGYGSNSTYIYALGTNPNDQAEHSENLTLSAEFKPTNRLTLTVDYFHINYTDRVGPPLSTYVGALTNPLYTQLVTRNPTATQQAQLIAGTLDGLQNISGVAYNAANVFAILDGRDQNIAKQIYKGVDLGARYDAPVGSGKELALSADVSWLDSKQQLRPGQPWTQMAGDVFFPPHVKGRAGATYTATGLTLSGYVNYIGGVTDTQVTPSRWVSGMTTLDLNARIKLPRSIELSLNISDLLNARPSNIYTNVASYSPYDTTNYSAVGRFLGLAIDKAW